MASSLKDWALFYRKQLHWSVIPINPKNKKPLIPWKEWSSALASEEQIEIWWNMWPDANIGLCTGQVSGVLVVDIDEHECTGSIEYMKEVYLQQFPGDPHPPYTHTVRAKTPRGGEHWFFLYTPGMVSRRCIPHVDLKTDGGYVIIAPSKINGKGYEWIQKPWLVDKRGKQIISPAIFPNTYKSLFDKKNPSTLTGECKRCGTTKYTTYNDGAPVGENIQPPKNIKENQERSISVPPACSSASVPDGVPYRSTAFHSVLFKEGQRDEDLFHIAHQLVKGRTDIETIREVLYRLGESCDPPFPKNEVEAKIISAVQRGEFRSETLARDVIEWIEEQEGAFEFRELDRVLGIKSKQEMSNRRKVIYRLKQEGVVEPLPGKSGVYRRIIREAGTIDYKNIEIKKTYEDFILPLGESELVHILPKQIILIPGVFDAGKTTYMMNVTELNQEKFPINYFSSEMGPMEFKSRIQLFRRALHDWNFIAKERSEDFHDVIVPDEVNIIDYLELHDNFYQVGGLIKRIFDKLTTGIAIIGIQKNPGVANPLGGSRAMEKARLVVNLDHEEGGLQKATITKAKNWKDNFNPRGLTRSFEIIDGCVFELDEGWRRDL